MAKPKLTMKQAKFVKGIAEGKKPSSHDKYIYLAYSNGYYKIGVSQRPKDRIESMKSGNPFGITLVHARQIRQAEYLERKLHTIMPEKLRLRGEWYRLNKFWLKRFIRLLNDWEKISYGNN